MAIDMRVTIASAVAVHMKDAMPSVKVRTTETTSGCPVVELTIGTDTYNLTITKARKMKSPMVVNADYLPEKSGYSDMQVLRSGAGWYIGTLYTDPADGIQEPGSRDSDYFATEEQAKSYLRTLEISGDEVAAIVLRNHP